MKDFNSYFNSNINYTKLFLQFTTTPKNYEEFFIYFTFLHTIFTHYLWER